jgi:hypothetical protein
VVLKKKIQRNKFLAWGNTYTTPELNGGSLSMSENFGSRKITTIHLIYYFIYLFLEAKSIVVIIQEHGITTDSF